MCKVLNKARDPDPESIVGAVELLLNVSTSITNNLDSGNRKARICSISVRGTGIIKIPENL